jgi:hypothetical protein
MAEIGRILADRAVGAHENFFLEMSPAFGRKINWTDGPREVIIIN